MTERNLGETVKVWYGTVTNVMDPHQSGRVQVRVFGRHDDTVNIPDADLPWAQVSQSVTSAARGRVGTAPVGLVVGSRVFGFWVDADQQYPLIIGTMGRAGEVIPGQTEGGAPAVNTAVGSIPGAAQNDVANPYSSLDPSRITIQSIDSGQKNVDSIPIGSGTVMTEAVEQGMSFAKLPTTGSADPSETNVLEILRRVDPTSSIAALQCFPSNALQLQVQIDLGSIASGLINVMTNAITNAILQLMDALGVNQILTAIEQAANGIADFRDALDALATGGLCGAPRALASIGSGTQALARSYANINNAAQRLNNTPDSIRAALNIGTSTLIANAPSAIFTPISVVVAVPVGYIQDYYAADKDPYPGYIRWYDPNDPNAQSVFTLRNGQPNFASAYEHTQFDVQQIVASALRASISGGNITTAALQSIVNQVPIAAQTQGLIRSIGNGFNPQNIAGMAALGVRLIPSIVSAVQGNFQAKISVSILPNATQLRTAATNFTRVQTSLAMRRARLETALRRI